MAKNSDEGVVYSGMTVWGFAAYIFDRHMVLFCAIVALVAVPGFFGFLFYAAKSAELQTELLHGTLSIFTNVKTAWVLGWVLAVGELALILRARPIYKEEIARLGQEKSELYERLGLKGKASGHVENGKG